MQANYYRDNYGQLHARDQYEIWQNAMNLIANAEKSKKIPESYDTISFDRKRRADGSAIHHEIYDIHPDPLRVLVCIRHTEGSKYGVRTVSKNYYLIKKHGRGASVSLASKAKAAKAAKAANCELGCAISVVDGTKKLAVPRACQDGIAYKKLAVDDNGRLRSVYDGSEWVMGRQRSDRAMQNHNGGLYVYETAQMAKNASFPAGSECKHLPKIIVKCRVAGNYCRYGSKLAFSHVTPLNVEEIVE